MKLHGGTLNSNILDFSANISPLGMHFSASESLHQLSLNPDFLCSYPDCDCVELRNLLSQFWSFDSQNIICSNGAVDLIFSISEIFSKKTAIILEPSFSEYENALKIKNKNISIQNTTDFYNIKIDFDIFFATSPSNPLGQILSFDDILFIEKQCEKNNAIFVLDSCFSQFSSDCESILRRIISQKENFPNLIILNAFTKFYGMAGLRLGFALCFSSEIAKKINENKISWSVNSVAQLCAISILKTELSKNSTWASSIQNLIQTEKSRFYNFFDSHKIPYFKSEANFITFNFDFDSISISNSKFGIEKNGVVEILQNKFQIRSCVDFKTLGKNYHRVAIKNSFENGQLLEILESIFSVSKKTIGKTKKALPLMIQGTMSNAGKSILVAGLCRIFKKDGFKVAPFKSQNMALNSGVTKDGLEMGRAQIMQAQACGIEPNVKMNPILLKPNSQTGSQIIVNGEIFGNMSAKDYFSFRKTLIPKILDSYNSLAEENDIIVIEGAGSPAEINLKKDDIVNMGLAELVDAPVLIAGDIDRGGVFASLYGTFSLVTSFERKRIKGFIINKFRGDKKLLDDGLEQLYNLTGKKILGVVPYISDLKIDDEDSLAFENLCEKNDSSILLNVFVVQLPYISNFTDINAFENIPFVRVKYFSSVLEFENLKKQFGNPDLMILPGSKNSIKAMEFLTETQNEKNISDLIKSFVKENLLIGICGGFQLLGELLDDSNGNEDSSKQKLNGLGLLPIKTIFTKEKTRIQVCENLPKVEGSFQILSDKKVFGYEIHQGITKDIKTENIVRFASNKNVFGSYIHGFFDSDSILQSILELLAEQKNIKLPKFESLQSKKEKEFDRLEKNLRESLNLEEIYKIIGIRNDTSLLR